MFDLNTRQNLAIQVAGIVQGVGFRPFVYQLARELGLKGWVKNSAQGVQIELSGDDSNLALFLERLQSEKPYHATIKHLSHTWVNASDYEDFSIFESDDTGDKSVLILPDLAICPDCLQDILDPLNRRYRYPFTNCTYCGPRFSIIRALPYDRDNTTMQKFVMCENCLAEYQNPLDRRFHAQPNACPECGPQLALWDTQGREIAQKDDALFRAAIAIEQGEIIACKGLGGFHLMVDARNETAVQRLRERKHRPDKPFATMFPNLDAVKQCCDLSPSEESALISAVAPIVLLPSKDNTIIAQNIAPNNPYLGVILPYTPLHILLMQALDFPIVATSGNLSDEPICIDEFEALEQLANIADLFLVHNRPIERPVDDSVLQVIQNEIQVLRAGRGYAPFSLELKDNLPSTISVGGHLKNTIAITHNNQVFLSQHIGDLETAQTHKVFECTIADFHRLYDIAPQQIVHDLHPDYLSTQYAQTSGLATIGVQHHVAHVLSGIVDKELKGQVLGIAWDGTGYGTDNTIWGGEGFLVKGSQVERVFHLRQFPLVGGDIATRETRRSAIGLLYETYGDELFQMNDLASLQAFNQDEIKIIQQMLSKQINSPITSSMGRLFDGVASILNLCQKSSFEGQAAMLLEFEAMKSNTDAYYPHKFHTSEIDWRPLVRSVIQDWRKHVSPEEIALKFHNTLVEIIVQVAASIGVKQVLLTGGCFQNRLLTENAISRLIDAGFSPYWHHRIPPNDGGIAIGQIFAVANHTQLKEQTLCV